MGQQLISHVSLLIEKTRMRNSAVIVHRHFRDGRWHEPELSICSTDCQSFSQETEETLLLTFTLCKPTLALYGNI